ncbi:MAG: IS66 family insertion sequence element accessory protein TnpB [Lactococcus chungangensis]|jgi:Transposase and inactivated derivatives|uniref:IS66 family insertion sequence element accessory protein TnpB n=1 Tax=Pseudolactococcus chungangensis TaxID=451457 RepID=A0A847J3G1_9LACT|nr:IS66 family insertion sequence element accessory protein TnpB [Lactococcus chungangensis]
MLIDFNQVKHAYLICGYTDLRKGIDGLAALVAHEYHLDLFDGTVFLFCGRRTDRFKALYFDGEGFILLYKHYDRGNLRWPRTENEAKLLSKKQRQWLFDGLSITQNIKVHPAKIGVLT